MSSSLFEYLIALLLVSLLTFLVFQPFRTLSQASWMIHREGELLEGGLLLKEHLQYGLNNYDTHRLEMAPRIHSLGAITFTSGDEIVFSEATSIDGEVPAISYLILDHTRRLRIHSLEHSGEKILAYACSNSDEKLIEKSVFLGVSVDGLVAVWGTMRSEGSLRCAEYELTSPPSLVIFENENIPEYLRVLIPIVYERTLYRDKNHQLRLLSTEAGRVVENQPLGRFPYRYGWDKRMRSSDGAIAFDLSIFEQSKDPRYQFQAQNILSRITPFHYLSYLSHRDAS